MIRKDGKDFPTVSDAAGKMKVSVKTIREWINNGVVSRPPSMSIGLRDIDIFPDEYLEKMRVETKRHKDEKKAKRRKQNP